MTQMTQTTQITQTTQTILMTPTSSPRFNQTMTRMLMMMRTQTTMTSSPRFNQTMKTLKMMIPTTATTATTATIATIATTATTLTIRSEVLRPKKSWIRMSCLFASSQEDLAHRGPSY